MIVLSIMGRSCWLDREKLIDLANGAAGSGPKYMFAFVEHFTKAGERRGPLLTKRKRWRDRWLSRLRLLTFSYR